MRKMKKESKMELEVFEKKREIQQQAMGDVSSAQTGQKAQRSTDIHELMEDESCSLCRSVLREIDTMDGKRRERAIQEYGQFERMMESADSSEEVKDFVKETDVLSQAIVDVI